MAEGERALGGEGPSGEGGREGGGEVVGRKGGEDSRREGLGWEREEFLQSDYGTSCVTWANTLRGPAPPPPCHLVDL